MEWKKATKNEDGLFNIPDRWLHLHYYEALNLLFRFENSLRVFVFVVLKTELREKWKDAAISHGKTINSEAKKRISQSRDHGYLGYEVTSPMLYLNSGELIDLIVSETYWKYFARYFKASKSIIVTKLQEIGTVRNALAHFRPIKEEDLDLIKQNTKHVLLEVEKCLVEIRSIYTPVPTNTETEWYNKISSLSSENLKIRLLQSSSEEWIRVELSYKIPTFSSRLTFSDSYHIKAGNLRTDRIIGKFEALRSNCVYVSESNLYGTFDSESKIDAQKEISVIFSKFTITNEIDELFAEFSDLVETIDQETELIRNDNWARGELVQAVSAWTSKTGNEIMSVELKQFATKMSEVNDVEFWGNIDQLTRDFISGAARYPWMPETVSEYEIPF